MNDQRPPELFSQRPPHMEYVQEQFSRAEVARMRSFRNRRIVTCIILALLIVGVLFEVVTWHSGPKEIPTLTADGSLKQKPEQPGGLDVPNQDIMAYQQLDNSGAKPPAEHMLPPPEEPQAVSASPAPDKNQPAPKATDNFAVPSVDALAPAPVTQQLNDSPPAANAAAANLPPVTSPAQKSVEVAPEPAKAPPEAAADSNKDNNPVPAAPAKTEKSAAKSSGGKKNYRVQLASFPDEDEASHQLGRMQAKYAEELGDARLHLARADLGARGIYYRVQSNPISDDDARDICAALKKLKAGCIIVKP